MKKLLFTLFVTIGYLASGQDSESYLKRAKALASEKEYAEASGVLYVGLERYPADHDLRSYQIRILLWAGDYSAGVVQIEKLLLDFPDDYEGLQLLIIKDWWSENWAGLLNSTESALSSFPNDNDFKLKKLLALKNLERYAEASDFLATLTETSPQLVELGNEIKMKHHHQIGISSSYAHFTEAFDPWILGTVNYQRISRSSLNVSATYGRMFDQNGTSFNAAYYPRFSKNLTGFVEVGTSQSVIFPELRVGAELTALMSVLEMSLGGKVLKFKEQEEGATLITAGLGKYLKNYFVNYKAWFAQVNSTRSLTHTLLVRRFFQNRFHYVQLNLANGATPLQINNFSEISRVSASAVNLTYSHLLFETIISSISLGGQKEDYFSGANRVRYTVRVGLSRIL
ncbi:MAG: YaiO family outer membrane beta-barrel protein [Cyclobacteriaceae bacterium]